MVAELSDFRIFGFPDVFCRLLTYLPGSFGFSDFPRFFESAVMVARTFRNFIISLLVFASCCHGCPDISEYSDFQSFCADSGIGWSVPGSFGIFGFPEVFCRFRCWAVGLLPFPSIGGSCPMVAELSDFRIFGFPDCFSRLLA